MALTLNQARRVYDRIGRVQDWQAFYEDATTARLVASAALGADQTISSSVAMTRQSLISLTKKERRRLEAVVRKHTVEQRMVLRPRIVLGAGGGTENATIASRLAVALNTVIMAQAVLRGGHWSRGSQASGSTEVVFPLGDR